MTNESKNQPDENPATDEASESNNSAGNPEKEVPSVKGSTEQAFEAAMAEAALEAHQITKQTLDPAMVEATMEAVEITQQAFTPAMLEATAEAVEITQQALDPAMVRATAEAAKITQQALNPAMVEATVEVLSSFSAPLAQLNSPSISDDISAISKTQHSGRASNSAQQSEIVKDSPTDVDRIRPPETRIHDQLIWDDGRWYRSRTWELSVNIVDYIFWKAKEGGELTDATDEEIGVASTAAVFVVALLLTWNPVSSISVAGAIGGATVMGSKAAKSRNYRKDLDSKFDSDEE